jgi:acetyl esterase/lipase
LLQLVQVLRWATSPDFEAALGVGIDASKVVLMGNSAGGNLSTALSLLLSFTSGACAEIRKALPDSLQLVAQVLLYPSVACNKPYLDRYNAGEAVVRADSLPVWAATLMEASYLPPGIDTAQIFMAPLDADVELLRTLKPPPVLCLTAGKDCLKYEANAYTDKLREAGISVSTHEYPNAVHGFSHHKKDYEEDRKDCWDKVSRFLRQKFES